MNPDRRNPRSPATPEREPQARSKFEELFRAYTVDEDFVERIKTEGSIPLSVDPSLWPGQFVSYLDVYFFDDATQEVEAWPVALNGKTAEKPVLLTYAELKGLVRNLQPRPTLPPAEPVTPDIHPSLLAIPFGEEDRVHAQIDHSVTSPSPPTMAVTVPPLELPKTEEVKVVPPLESILPRGETIEQFADRFSKREKEIVKLAKDTLGWLQVPLLGTKLAELTTLVPDLRSLLDDVATAKRNLGIKRSSVGAAFDDRIIAAHTAELQFVRELNNRFSDEGIKKIANSAASVKVFLGQNDTGPLPEIKQSIKKIAAAYRAITQDMAKRK